MLGQGGTAPRGAMMPDIVTWRSTVAVQVSQAHELYREAQRRGDPFALLCAEAAVKSADALLICLTLHEELAARVDGLEATASRGD
jgi:hypothetical protein